MTDGVPLTGSLLSRISKSSDSQVQDFTAMNETARIAVNRRRLSQPLSASLRSSLRIKATSSMLDSISVSSSRIPDRGDVSGGWHSAVMGFQSWLEELSDRELARLIKRRPDVLVGDRPTSVAEIAARLCAPAGIYEALQQVDGAALHLAASLPTRSPGGSATSQLIALGLAWSKPDHELCAADPLVSLYASTALPPRPPQPPILQVIDDATVGEYSARAAADVLDICRLLIESAVAKPIALARSGGVGARECARLETAVGCSPRALELSLNLAVAAELLRLDSTSASPGMNADTWLCLGHAARFQSILMAWWNHPGVLLASTNETEGKADGVANPRVAPLMPQAVTPSYGELRRGLAATLAIPGLGNRVLDEHWIMSHLAWHRTLAWQHLGARTSVVLNLIGELDTFGVIVDYAISPLGLALVDGDMVAIETICQAMFEPGEVEILSQPRTSNGHGHATTVQFRVEPQSLGVLVAPGTAPNGARIDTPQGIHMGNTSHPVTAAGSDRGVRPSTWSAEAERTSSTLHRILGQFPSPDHDESRARALVKELRGARELDSLGRRAIAQAVCDNAPLHVTVASSSGTRPHRKLLGHVRLDGALQIRNRAGKDQRIALDNIIAIQPVWPATRSLPHSTSEPPSPKAAPIPTASALRPQTPPVWPEEWPQ